MSALIHPVSAAINGDDDFRDARGGASGVLSSVSSNKLSTFRPERKI
jgi:hypothetical protein